MGVIRCCACARCRVFLTGLVSHDKEVYFWIWRTLRYVCPTDSHVIGQVVENIS